MNYVLLSDLPSACVPFSKNNLRLTYNYNVILNFSTFDAKKVCCFIFVCIDTQKHFVTLMSIEKILSEVVYRYYSISNIFKVVISYSEIQKHAFLEV